MRRVFFLFVAAAALLAGNGQQAAAVNNQLQVDADTTTPGIQSSRVVNPSSGNFTVQVWVQNVTTTNCHPAYPSQPCGLGAYTLEMTFDPAVVSYQSFSDGPFLRSTGRGYSWCPLIVTGKHDPANGVIAVSCTTQGGDPLGPTGSGHLATVTFAPVAIGSTTLEIDQSALSDIAGGSICHPDYTPCATQGGSVSVNYKADLSVTKTAPSPVAAPGNISYTLQVTNGGPEQATGVALVDTLPAEVTFSSASPECTYDAGPPKKVNCSLGTLTNGQNKSLNVTTSVAATQAGKTVVNQADVTTTSIDLVSSNNHAEGSTQVSSSNLNITKTVPRDVGLGAAGQYVINVSSTGPSTAAAAVAQDTLPVGVTYVNAGSTVGSCSYDGGLRKVTCNLGDMALSSSATITINVTFPNYATYVGNIASVTWTNTPAGNKSTPMRWTYIAQPDTDGDGCHDFQELRTPWSVWHQKGGGRDPNNAYDFYDVPTPPIHSVGSAATKDYSVTGQDLSALLLYGSSPSYYNEDVNLDGVADGRSYDHRKGTGDKWGPDGAITGLDLSRMLAEGGDSCVAALQLQSPRRRTEDNVDMHLSTA